MIGEMGEKAARAFLASHNLGRLSCSLNDQPYVTPVHYLFAGENLYLHSLPGRKIDILRANPAACLLVDSIEDDYHWRSVLALGQYEELTDAAEREHWLARIYAELPLHSPVESRMHHDRVPLIVFRLRLTSVTGRFEKWV
jgi:nitroimidazol reductase NimA-like FMN-containing flavoprotein (pyridoxamine 5'-phosphate oxidase superfamily)